MRLYIIRHGQTEWNSTYRLQGRTNTRLNENGLRLAVETGKGLAAISFDLAYSSPLSRAKETARLVLDQQKDRNAQNDRSVPNDRSAPNGKNAQESALRGSVPIIEDERLLEISFGVMEGQKVRDDNGVLVVDNFVRFFNDPERYLPPDEGESFQSLLVRTGDFLEELKRKDRLIDGEAETDGEGRPVNILISTHGAASRALLANITHCPLRDFWCGGVPKNCAVTIVDLENGDWKIKEQDVLFASV
ncbi:MAG: histidine phosphatase family protein [Clostridiales bacterium]|nr:histidine phosphatase family protein [Clostridiales bacterium]